MIFDIFDLDYNKMMSIQPLSIAALSDWPRFSWVLYTHFHYLFVHLLRPRLPLNLLILNGFFIIYDLTQWDTFYQLHALINKINTDYLCLRDVNWANRRWSYSNKSASNSLQPICNTSRRLPVKRECRNCWNNLWIKLRLIHPTPCL